MYTGTLPAFTAEAALYQPRADYHRIAASDTRARHESAELAAVSRRCVAACARISNDCTYGCSPFDTSCRDRCNTVFDDCFDICEQLPF
jgi:hypothetical protein